MEATLSSASSLSSPLWRGELRRACPAAAVPVRAGASRAVRAQARGQEGAPSVAGAFGALLGLMTRGGARAGQEAGAGASSGGLTYKEAGVDIDAGNELVKRIAKMTPGIGGFGGVYPFGDHYLVAGTDGVGTKLRVAFDMNLHDTIGIDLVAMSVNDIVTLGAKPMFFLDYFASSKLDVDQAQQVIQGIVDGCKESDCALLGGETAEMPGFYKDGEYDLSGFAVGAVKKTDLIDGSTIVPGDIILGLPSSGLHSNGFSLARKIVEVSGQSLHDPLPGSDISIGRALLAPTTLYVRQVLKLLEGGGIKGIAHITGGGFTENIPRVLPKGVAAQIIEGSWQEPPIFAWLRKAGNVDEEEMRRVFNLGIGMILVVTPERADQILGNGQSTGPVYKIGRTVAGQGVEFTAQ